MVYTEIQTWKLLLCPHEKELVQYILHVTCALQT